MPQAFKILVVDDEPDLEPLVLQRMRRRIRSGQYTFLFAQNGVEALERLREEEDVDMVISDINMPQMDGLTLLEQIPKVDPNVRSIIISAYGDMKNIRTAMNRGAFDFVTKPLDFDDLQLTIDRTLAHLVEWREALSSRDRLVSLENELNVASKIQSSILPTEFPDGQDYAVFASMEPAKEVGGDFYDVIHLGPDRVGIAIADVSDKGVPAALFMMSSRTLLKGSAIGNFEPGDVLREVNDLLCEGNDAMMFVTLLYAVYNINTGKTDLRQRRPHAALRAPGQWRNRCVARHRRDCPGRAGWAGICPGHLHGRTGRYRVPLLRRRVGGDERRGRGVRRGPDVRGSGQQPYPGPAGNQRGHI